MFASAGAVLALLAFSGTSAAQMQENCQLVQLASLEIGTDASGGVYVPMSIGGKDYNMLVDTGGIYGTLNAGIATDLKLPRHPIDMFRMRMNMIDGKRLDQYVTLDSVQLGKMSADKVSLVLMPGDRLPDQIAGTLSPDVLHNYDVEFDFADAKMNLFSQDHCEGRVVYWTHEPFAQIPMRLDEYWHIVFPVILDGQHLTATLDTGSSRSIISVKAASDLFGWTDGGDKKPVFKSLTIQGVTINNPDVIVIPSSHMGTGDQMIVGMDVLRRLRLYIAYKEQTLYVTGAGAH
jgi:predicted aspartyl protease